MKNKIRPLALALSFIACSSIANAAQAGGATGNDFWWPDQLDLNPLA